MLCKIDESKRILGGAFRKSIRENSFVLRIDRRWTSDGRFGRFDRRHCRTLWTFDAHSRIIPKIGSSFWLWCFYNVHKKSKYQIWVIFKVTKFLFSKGRLEVDGSRIRSIRINCRSCLYSNCSEKNQKNSWCWMSVESSKSLGKWTSKNKK